MTLITAILKRFYFIFVFEEILPDFQLTDLEKPPSEMEPI